MIEQSNNVYVSYCCSDLFAEVCAVSVVSLFENNRALDAITVYIIDDKMSEKSKERFYDLAQKYSRTIQFISLPDPCKFYGDSRFTIKSLGRTYARMILGTVLPESCHRVMSLDSDTMIFQSVSELWNIDLNGFGMAGVDDCMGKIALVKTQHLPADTAHCNAGMFLIDLARWREENWTKQFFEYIKTVFDSGKSLGGYEEEVMNKVLLGRIRVLPPRFNLMTLEQVLSYDEIWKFRQPLKYYSKEEIEEAKQHPVITHTTNFLYIRKRIFEENSDHPMRRTYEKYRAMTPWCDDLPMTTNPTFKQRMQKDVWHMMPRSMAIVTGAFVRNHIRPLFTKKRTDE